MPEPSNDDPVVTRVRSAVLPRWRSYLPGLLLAVSGLVAVAVPDATRIDALGLDPSQRAARILLASALVLVATAAVALARRAPLPTLVVGALAVSLGGNVLAPRWVALPVTLAGLGWLATVETRRLQDGIALTASAVLLPRPLRRPLRLPFDAIRAVHLAADRNGAASIILETEDGTFAVAAIRGAHALVARIEARRARVPVEATPDSVAASRARIEDILGAGAP